MKLEILSKREGTDVQKAVISGIKELINYKNLEPGDKLPSERSLSEKFEVPRSVIRETIQKLEYYDILKSIPQSGTFIADIGVTAMNGMIDDILALDEPDFKSLVETRILLELKTVKLAAIRRTKENLADIEAAHDAFAKKVTNKEEAVEEDLLFHLAIARACGNSTINTFMLSITPEIINNFTKHHVCDPVNARNIIEEHKQIVEAIREQNPDLAKEKMKHHFKLLYEYCYNV